MELLTIKETAKYLKVSVSTIHSYSKRGALKKHKIGNQVRFKKDEVDKSLREVNTSKIKRK